MRLGRQRRAVECGSCAVHPAGDGEAVLDRRRDAAIVGRWRQRFVTKRVDGLLDEPRPGAPRKITDADVERVLRLTLETTPRDATHWSTRAMAKRAGLSQTAISRIWRAFVLQPWAQVQPDAVLPGLGGGPVAVLADTAPDRAGIRWMALDWWNAPEGSA